MSITDGLNDAQFAAVTAGIGPVLVLAGPGSGKTRVLTHRIAYLMQTMQVKPWHIMAVTFTNKAAREMRERVEKIMGENLSGLLMGTFHSTCARILRRESDALALLGYTRDFVIFDADDQKQVVKQVLKELNLDDKKFKPANMLNNISSAKDKLITPELYESADYIGEVTKRVYTQYQATLVANNALDFDDLLLVTVRLFDEQPEVLQKYQQQYHHILVDEFQDTNTVQYGLLKRLATGHGNIFAVGDSDQSIYKWRGADFRNIQRFRDEYPSAQQVLLEQNYRSTQKILDVAKAVIVKNQDRVHKDLFTDRKGGINISIKEAYNEIEEADQVVKTIAGTVLEGFDPGDCAVMYRTNAQSRVLEEAFMRAGLPYRLVGGTRFYGRREIKDIIAYLRVVHNLRDDISFRRAINTPKRGVGAKSLEKLLAWGATQGLQGAEATVKLATSPDIALPIRGRALSGILKFGTLLNTWIRVREEMPVGELLSNIIEQIDFNSYLDDGTDEGRDRWANVLELKGVASDEQMPLTDFLEKVALVSDIDDLDDSVSAPTLLTLHASKGLEFPVVFITGVEDGILPHSRTFDDGEEMAEERRLFYVGITRAKERLYLMHAFRRSLYGMSDAANPSRFLADIPGELVDGGNQIARRYQQSQQRKTSWGGGSSNQRSGHSAYTPKSRHTRHEGTPTKRAWTPSTPARSYGTSNRRQTTNTPSNRNLPKPRSAERETTREPKITTAQFKTGMNVSHKKFGKGIVVESKLTGNDEEVTVAFTEHGIKRLVASFAKLDIVE